MSQVAQPWDKFPRVKYARWRDHLRFCNEALLHCVVHLLTTFFVVLLIGVSIALPAGLWVIRDHLSHAELVWPAERGFNAFLKSETADSDVERTVDALMAHADVSDVASIPREEALEEFLTATDLPLLDFQQVENPLPHTLTVFVREAITQQEINELVLFVQGIDTIEHVSHDAERIERLSAIYGIFNRLLWVIGVTFSVFALFVCESAVRVAIEERLHEIRVLHVIGSPLNQIRGPFLWCGCIYGLLGGFLAAVLLTLVLMHLERPVQILAASYGIAGDLQSLDWIFVVSLTLIGAALGLVSGYYSTFRHMFRVTKNWVV